MSSSEDNPITELSTIMETNKQPEKQSILQINESSSSNSSEENDKEKEKKSWIYMIQPETHGDHIDDLITYYNRTRTKYKEFQLNEFYVSKIQTRLAYNLKRKEIKHPFTFLSFSEYNNRNSFVTIPNAVNGCFISFRFKLYANRVCIFET